MNHRFHSKANSEIPFSKITTLTTKNDDCNALAATLWYCAFIWNNEMDKVSGSQTKSAFFSARPMIFNFCVSLRMYLVIAINMAYFGCGCGAFLSLRLSEFELLSLLLYKYRIFIWHILWPHLVCLLLFSTISRKCSIANENQ